MSKENVFNIYDKSRVEYNLVESKTQECMKQFRDDLEKCIMDYFAYIGASYVNEKDFCRLEIKDHTERYYHRNKLILTVYPNEFDVEGDKYMVKRYIGLNYLMKDNHCE